MNCTLFASSFLVGTVSVSHGGDVGRRNGTPRRDQTSVVTRGCR